MAIPPEICGMICQDSSLARSDLLALCAVSRAFQNEAERLLYVSVRLPSDMRLIKTWCRALARRPGRADRVRALSLSLPLPAHSIDPLDIAKVTRALGACTGLRELAVLDDGEAAGGAAENSTYHWILLGHAFRLQSFVNTYFDAAGLARFLAEQRELRVLVLRFAQAYVCLPQGALPRLTTVDLDASVLEQIAGGGGGAAREIRRLRYHCHTNAVATHALLAGFGATLTSLCLRRCFQTEMPAFICALLKNLPGLKYLKITDDAKLVQLSPFPLLLAGAPPTTLETLILQPARRRCPVPNHEWHCFYAELDLVGQRRQTARAIMEAIPSLRQLVLVSDESHSFRRTERGSEYEGIVTVDEDAWMAV